MAASSLVSVICKKIIKPSNPTPLPLRSLKLSFIDQVVNKPASCAFFYPKTGSDHKSYEPTHVSQILEKSLSETLSFYYPYAGRLMKDGCSIDCNDVGVELSHVRVHCPMSDILKHSDISVENVVHPVAQPHRYNEESLAKAQVSYFDCGGIVIGGAFSHKIGDGCTLGNLFTNWGVLSRETNAKPSPYFVGDSIYPQSNDPSVVSAVKLKEQGHIGRRFVFSAAKVNALKAMFSNDSGIQNPVTRTEVVSALLYKCAAVASGVHDHFGSFKPSSLIHFANMRQRVNPPLSHNACGNILSYFSVKTTNEKDLNCPRLISEMKKEKEKLCDKENGIVSTVLYSVERGENPTGKSNEVNYACSSLFGFPFYKTDFGWGMPTRVSIEAGPRSNYFFLMDNQSGGGVEAIVILSKQDMSILERDPELLEFAVPFPNL